MSAKQVVESVSCPNCKAHIGRGCWWFYGYDAETPHPERWDRYRQFLAERNKSATWNDGVSSPAGKEPQK